MTTKIMAVPQTFATATFAADKGVVLDTADWALRSQTNLDNNSVETLFVYVGAGADPAHEVTIRLGYYNAPANGKTIPGTNISSKFSTWETEELGDGTTVYYARTFTSAETVKGRQGISNVRDFLLARQICSSALLSTGVAISSTDGTAEATEVADRLAFGVLPVSL